MVEDERERDPHVTRRQQRERGETQAARTKFEHDVVICAEFRGANAMRCVRA